MQLAFNMHYRPTFEGKQIVSVQEEEEEEEEEQQQQQQY